MSFSSRYPESTLKLMDYVIQESNIYNVSHSVSLVIPLKKNSYKIMLLVKINCLV